jgi:hypothetical protein
MSQANVDIAKRLLNAYTGRDVDTFAALATKDFEWFTVVAWLSSQHEHSVAEIAKLVTENTEVPSLAEVLEVRLNALASAIAVVPAAAGIVTW